MSLPSDESELVKTTEFVVGRWKLEHDWKSTVIQAICLGIKINCEDYLEIIRSYVRVNDPNKQPQTGDDTIFF
jgi:hypothetical protein